jgi:hypothetical protein
MEMIGEEIQSGDYLCTDGNLQNAILLAYCGILQLQCNLCTSMAHNENVTETKKKSFALSVS